MQTKTARQTKK